MPEIGFALSSDDHPPNELVRQATIALMPWRFFLGVGTGENLNEHVLGDRWPLPDERL
jgi:hypothetical protein